MSRRKIKIFLIRTIAALSMSGFLLVNSFWVRSYWVADSIWYKNGQGGGGFVINYRGALYFTASSETFEKERGINYTRVRKPSKDPFVKALLTGDWQVGETHVGVPHAVASAILGLTAIAFLPFARGGRVGQCPACGGMNADWLGKCVACGTAVITSKISPEHRHLLRRARRLGLRIIAPVAIVGIGVVAIFMVRSYFVADNVSYADGNSQSWGISSNAGVIHLSVVPWHGQPNSFHYNKADGSNIGDEGRSMFDFEHAFGSIHIRFPHLFASLVLGGIAVVCIRGVRQSRVNTGSHCENCGYDLRASPERCPECGTLVIQTKNPDA